METVYDAPGIALTTYDPATGLILARWRELSRHTHTRPCIEKQMALVAAGARFVVVDVSEASGVPSLEDQEWFATTVFPFYAAHGLGALVNVVARSAVTNLGASRWLRNAAASGGFETHDAPTLPGALDLLRTRYGVAVPDGAATTW
jgi:hypothetical protein